MQGLEQAWSRWSWWKTDIPGPLSCSQSAGKPSNLRSLQSSVHAVHHGAGNSWLCIADTLCSSAVLGTLISFWGRSANNRGCTCEYVLCLYMCPCSSQRLTVIFLSLTSSYFLRHGYLLNQYSARLASQKLQEPSCLCLLNTKIIGTPLHHVSMWVWGIELRSSCLHAVLTAIFPAPNPGHFVQWGSVPVVLCASCTV